MLDSKTSRSDPADVTNVEACVTRLYTALTVLLVTPEDDGARRIAAETLTETRPVLLSIMRKAGF